MQKKDSKTTSQSLRISDGLFQMNKAIEYHPDPSRADINFNPDNLIIKEVNLNSDFLPESRHYTINCLIRLSDGSIHPGSSTILHRNSENNEVATSYILTPFDVVPLQYIDEDNEELIVHNHIVLTDLNSEEFPTPFKNIILRQDIEDHRIIKESIPESLITPDPLEPLTVDEQALLSYDLNYCYPRINGSEYVIRVRKGVGLGFEPKYGEWPILYKFATGIQAVGTVFATFNPCLPFCFTILHNRVMTLLTDSNYRELLGVENIEELCPFKTFDIKYNEETEKVELSEIFEIEKDEFLEMLNFDSSEFE